MLLVSDNLRGIVASSGLCPLDLVEEFSVGVRLHSTVRRVLQQPRVNSSVVYGLEYPAESFFEPLETVQRDLDLAPGARVLACSADRYAMPRGYFGLLQTKGSLARLFVSVSCNDGQVEPGYKGRITLEIVNHSPFAVTLPVRATVGQLFIFRCTTEVSRPYDGKYQDADEPTLAKF